MSGYTQAQLETIFGNAGVLDASVIRRLTDVIIKSYLTYTPTYNYNTVKYLSAMGGAITQVALASYGKNYTAAQIQTMLLGSPYFCSQGFAAVTAGVLIVQSLLAVLEQGSEMLSETDFATVLKWSEVGDFTISGGNAAYLHSSAAGTLTQLSTDMIGGAGLTGSSWYKFDYTVSGVVNAAHILTCNITTGILDAALEIPVTVAGKYTAIFKTKSSPGNFVISATSDAATTAFILDDVSIKKISNILYSSDKNHATLPYVEEYILRAWHSIFGKLSEGELSTYGNIRKYLEPEYDADLND